MNNRGNDRLSDAEIEIMKLLWQSEKPLRAGEIVKLLADLRSWKTQTAHVLLGRLCDKGYVSVDKSEYFHKFTPTMTENEYVRQQAESLIKKTGFPVSRLVAALIDMDNITDEDIDEITEMLEKKRAEIGK